MNDLLLRALVVARTSKIAGESTNRRLLVNDAVGFRDMPTTHVTATSLTVICRGVKTTRREISFECFLPIIWVFLEKLLRGEQIEILQVSTSKISALKVGSAKIIYMK